MFVKSLTVTKCLNFEQIPGEEAKDEGKDPLGFQTTFKIYSILERIKIADVF